MREIERMMPTKALVKLVPKSVLEDRSFELIRLSYDKPTDWEVGIIEQIGGHEDWDGLEVGDYVLTRAGGVDPQAGGPAGADVSKVLGDERKNTHIIVSPHEILVKVEV